MNDLIVDNFAGGGGASLGIELALGRSPDIAVNHDPEAVAMHTANHPTTKHYCESVWKVDPVEACAGRPVGLAWFSPDCKHFSKAKGGKPVEKKIRGLAWVVIRWAKAVKPRVIILENVEEFQTWGPLLEDGRPCPARRGFTFRKWKAQLERCGYVVESRELRACDYGAPTSRKRLFVVARSDGQPIAWPEPTHGPGRIPYRTAADCIDWSLACPSIFDRKKPLAENTLRRIARGIRRYVIDSAKPFIIPVAHAGDERTHSVDDPMPTVTGAHRGEHALITPFIAGVGGRQGQSPERSVDRPYQTVTAKADSAVIAPIIVPMQHANRPTEVDEPLQTVTTQHNKFNLVAPTLIQTGYGERPGQAPRSLDLHAPLGTVVGGGAKHALVSAFLAKHYGGNYEGPGAPLDAPAPTVTAVDHNALVASHLLRMNGSMEDRQTSSADLASPFPTVTAHGNHFFEVRAFLEQHRPPAEAQLSFQRTAPGIVRIDGTEYAMVDVGMRMLVPRELFRAQGFPDTYRIEFEIAGKPLSKTAQVRMCGNSVCPPIAAAIVRANFVTQSATVAA